MWLPLLFPLYIWLRELPIRCSASWQEVKPVALSLILDCSINSQSTFMMLKLTEAICSNNLPCSVFDLDITFRLNVVPSWTLKQRTELTICSSWRSYGILMYAADHYNAVQLLLLYWDQSAVFIVIITLKVLIVHTCFSNVWIILHTNNYILDLLHLIATAPHQFPLSYPGNLKIHLTRGGDITSSLWWCTFQPKCSGC